MSAFRITDDERRVNGFRNRATLTGFVSKIDKDSRIMRLMMSDNEALAVPIHLRPQDNVRLHVPLTVECHIFGMRDKNNQAYCEARAVRIDRPTTMAMPTLAAWYGANIAPTANQTPLNKAATANDGADALEEIGAISESGTKKESAFRPFMSDGKLRGWLKNHVDDVDSTEERNMRILADIADATGYNPNTNNGGNNNVTILVGIVDSRVIVPATEHRQAHGIVFLRQHEDASKSIPIWIVGQHFRKHMESLFIGMPIWVLGQARFKVFPTEDGGIIEGGMHIRCWEFHPADLKTDLTFTPPWWEGMKDRIIADRKARISAADADKLIKQKIAAEKLAGEASSEKTEKKTSGGMKIVTE